MKLRLFHLLSLPFLFAQCFPLPKSAGEFSEEAFNDMAKKMSKGPVKNLSVNELLRKNKDTIILLDTRERAEFDTSHLEGARWVGFKEFDPAGVADLPKDSPIVVYCSVGYRSERIGDKLQNAGFKQILNLEGGIFDWVNKGNPVVGENGSPVQVVHGYNLKWGKWVKQGKVVY